MKNLLFQQFYYLKFLLHLIIFFQNLLFKHTILLLQKQESNIQMDYSEYMLNQLQVLILLHNNFLSKLKDLRNHNFQYRDKQLAKLFHQFRASHHFHHQINLKLLTLFVPILKGAAYRLLLLSFPRNLSFLYFPQDQNHREKSL